MNSCHIAHLSVPLQGRRRGQPPQHRGPGHDSGWQLPDGPARRPPGRLQPVARRRGHRRGDSRAEGGPAADQQAEPLRAVGPRCAEGRLSTASSSC